MKLISYSILIFIFTILFLFLRPIPYEQISVYKESWAWNKSSEFGLKNDPRFSENPKTMTNGYKNGKSIYLFSLGKQISSTEEGDLFDYPLLGKGYFAYKKIGDKITYFSPDGEVLWKKPYSSYPISTWKGKLNFLVAGDGNQILVLDRNGNQTGAMQLDGNFFVDTAETVKHGAVLLFSGGEIYRLDENGKIIFQKKTPSTEAGLQFFKSVAISPDGKWIALHYFENGIDLVSILDANGNPSSRKIQLPHIYPHKIFMAINLEGKVLFNLRDAILLFDKSGNLIHKTVKKQKENVYQISFATNNLFLASMGDNLLFLNGNGEFLFARETPAPARVYPNENEDGFFLETKDDLIYYKKF